MIDYLMEKGGEKWEKGLEGSCFSGNKEMVELFLRKGARGWEEAFYNACSSGNEEIAERMISLGANNLLQGFTESCRSGNFKLSRFIFSKMEEGAWNKKKNEDWKEIEEKGLNWAAQGGNLELILFLVSKGCTNYEEGLLGGVEMGDLEVIDLMISKGARINYLGHIYRLPKTAIDWALTNNDLPSTYRLLYYGSALPLNNNFESSQLVCLKHIFQDFQEKKLWNPKSHKHFPPLVHFQFLSFYFSLSFLLKKWKIVIQKAILIRIFQLFISETVLQNSFAQQKLVQPKNKICNFDEKN